MTRIVAGSNSLRLAEKAAGISGVKTARKTVKRFPDGETYVRLEDADFKGEKVFIIHSLFPDQNESLVELLLTISAVKENGGRPCLVIPYFAYGRQDKVFGPGEAFSLKAAGTESIVTVDAHFHREEGAFDLFGLPTRNITAVRLLREEFGKDVTVVGPDEGSKDFLTPLEGAVFMRKEKRMIEKGDGKVHYEIEIDAPGIENTNVLLMDDIISGGGTIISAAKTLKEKGNRVSVACTHGLFLMDSLKELGKYADKIVSTDTVESECSKVSVAGLIAENLS
jgi:ribose-phosphate pyrophosphokinase